MIAGQRWIPGEIAAKLGDCLTLDTLTNREAAVLGRVAVGEANKQIADALQLSKHTVKDYTVVLASRAHQDHNDLAGPQTAFLYCPSVARDGTRSSG